MASIIILTTGNADAFSQFCGHGESVHEPDWRVGGDCGDWCGVYRASGGDIALSESDGRLQHNGGGDVYAASASRTFNAGIT